MLLGVYALQSGVYDDREKSEESCEWFDLFGDEKNEKQKKMMKVECDLKKNEITRSL